jgi:predicted alpha/beta superfamily hydrolase
MKHTPIYTRLAPTVALCLFWLAALQAQLTLKITAIPSNTPANSSIHAAGTFNNWNPGDPGSILALNTAGQYTITINPPAGQVKFKFTRGSWPTVEGNANGGFLPDRVVNYNGQPTTLDLTVLSWEDLGNGGGGSGGNGTAAANVQIMSQNFSIPQLNRTRRIWLYLPPDYNTTTKRYPVLYMHDGQNLFDDNTSFSGEWGVDETLNDLHAQGDYGCIVVGIDNGGQYRLDEYSPWVNPNYGGGQGDEYIEFIVNTLKPYIDANYRTLSQRNSTGIMGSSMGGLISMYGFSEHQDVFSRVGAFSPAFWFAGDNAADHVAAHPKEGDARVYFLAGGQEPAYVTTDMNAVATAMTTAGFGNSEKKTKVVSSGTHSEWFWKQEFGEAYQWLFAGAVSSTQQPNGQQWLVYPNPATTVLRFEGLESEQDIKMRIFTVDGRLQRDTALSSDQPTANIGDLPAGYYFLEITTRSAQKRCALVKN